MADRTITGRVRLLRRRKRVRSKVSGTAQRPRLAVFRSHRHLYAQLIDDVSGRTLAAASDLGLKRAPGGRCKTAEAVGRLIARAAKSKQITGVVFDRAGRRYHGRVKAFAEAARTAGLQF
ncbi:50S ribosomal protein L18 [Candidatus Parcubacteria bacterium]|nr:50S ribosomal protein L18 [Candidatus Parcubacteria bacterium]MBI4098967.1 50S ribosomal protein L18 [Candidatus Parcubacteria bacterium]MBI4385328.1 50S ribosomal protein L18 [Candidatus Parcubacteria bacterium]